MTLEEIDEVLPNGLHDAQINQMIRDYDLAEIILKVKVLVGLPAQPRPDRDRYRSGRIHFRQVYFCSVEPPLPESSFRHPGGLWFSYGRTQADAIPDGLAKALPAGTQYYSLFVRDWFSHIHLAAEDVSFAWSESA